MFLPHIINFNFCSFAFCSLIPLLYISLIKSSYLSQGSNLQLHSICIRPLTLEGREVVDYALIISLVTGPDQVRAHAEGATLMWCCTVTHRSLLQEMGQAYVLCFYFVCTVFTTVGFGIVFENHFHSIVIMVPTAHMHNIIAD